MEDASPALDGCIDRIEASRDPYEFYLNRGFTSRMVQTPVQRYLPIPMERIQNGDIDRPFVTTHRAGLADDPDLYAQFRDKKVSYIRAIKGNVMAKANFHPPSKELVPQIINGNI